MRPINPNEKTLAPVRPNAGLEAEYARRMRRLIDEMHNSVIYWLKAAYRANSPEMLAQDELPATTLRKAMRELQTHWRHRFDDAADDLAKYFSLNVDRRSRAALQNMLRRQGFTVKFKMTRPMRDILRATVNANVSLIKSIPHKYLQDVEGAVMRSVQTGRDLESLTRDITKLNKVSKRRAALIARDQNNKATASFTTVRQQELGIQQAVWVHSTAGKVPRKSHLKAGRDKVRYDVNKGWYDPDEKEWIRPGQLIGCRCVSRSVIPGFVS